MREWCVRGREGEAARGTHLEGFFPSRPGHSTTSQPAALIRTMQGTAGVQCPTRHATLPRFSARSNRATSFVIRPVAVRCAHERASAPPPPLDVTTSLGHRHRARRRVVRAAAPAATSHALTPRLSHAWRRAVGAPACNRAGAVVGRREARALTAKAAWSSSGRVGARAGRGRQPLRVLRCAIVKSLREPAALSRRRRRRRQAHSHSGGRGWRPQGVVCMHAQAGRSSKANSWLPGGQERRYLPFHEARDTVRALGLLNQQVRLCLRLRSPIRPWVWVRIPPPGTLLFALEC